MWKLCATSSRKFGQKWSRNLMPRVLVQRLRDEMWCDKFGFGGQIVARKDHIMWWMLLAESRLIGGNKCSSHLSLHMDCSPQVILFPITWWTRTPKGLWFPMIGTHSSYALGTRCSHKCQCLLWSWRTIVLNANIPKELDIQSSQAQVVPTAFGHTMVEKRVFLVTWHTLAPNARITCTVRAEIITELILKRAGPVIFKTFLLKLISCRPIPVICPARGVKSENYWKRKLIPNRTHPAKKSVIFQKLIPGNIFPDPL